MNGVYTRRGMGALLLASGVVATGSACADRSRGSTQVAQPVFGPMVNAPQEGSGDIEVLRIDVVNGKFGHRVYHVQPGAIELRFFARGTGPHAVMIHRLMQARLIPAGQETTFHLTATPGEYRMVINGGAQDQAILNVRPVGTR